MAVNLIENFDGLSHKALAAAVTHYVPRLRSPVGLGRCGNARRQCTYTGEQLRHRREKLLLTAPPFAGDDFPTTEVLEALGLSELLPAALAAWRPVVLDGARFFLRALPPTRVEEIIARQLELDAAASPAQRLATLLGSCPTLHKLGQVVARQPHLHADLRRQLQTLESMPASTPMSAIRRRIRSELGPRAKELHLDDAALAEGSVAVVLPFAWRERGRLRDGVLKVLKPGVETRLAQELALLPALASLLERRSAEEGLPAIDFRGPLASVAQLLSEEIRLDREQAHLRHAAAFHADERGLRIPALLPWCAPRVTAMERIHGRPLTAAPRPARDAQRLGATLVTALLAKPFWSQADPAIFHGDLHGGNLLVDERGRIAVIDWALIARISKLERETMVAIALGALTLDVAQIRRALDRLGMSTLSAAHADRIIGHALERAVCGAQPLGFNWLISLMDELALAGAKGFSAPFAVFRKSWMSLAGVLRDLDAPVNADHILLQSGLARFVAEWPRRALAAPGARNFDTHVSNLDLAQLGSSAWATAARYWTRLAGGSLHAPPPHWA